MSVLRNEKIIIKPVDENIAPWIEEGKDGRVRWENTEVVFDAPLTSTGVMRVLTEIEQAEIETAIDPKKPKGWLTPYAKEGNAWRGKDRYKLVIPSDGVTLDLSDPDQYILYKLATMQIDEIAPSYAEREDRKYAFYMESLNNIETTKTIKMDKLMSAQEYFAKISDNDEKMRNLLLVLYRGDSTKVPIDLDRSALKTKLFEYIQDRTDMFLDAIKDPDALKYRILYYKAIERGAFERKGHEIRAAYINGKLIGTTIEDAINYIKGMEADDQNQEEFAKFLERIKR